jgi:broad specificity phosphatase PhoE
MVALAELQETTTNMIDMGRPISELEKEWPDVDWSHIDPTFPSKEGMHAYSATALVARGTAARKWLRERPEKVIAVVSHAGFLRVGLCNRHFGNADWRVFDFEEDELLEWAQTERNGGGMGVSYKGVAGWEVNDFKYMKGNEGLSTEELVELCGSTPLR